MPTTLVSALELPLLPRKHRAWIALYALEDCEQNRAAILRVNDVTEADLAEFEESWLRLRCRSLSPNR
ncbi:hypothetical protein [Hymenobacter lucidus]|uniref:Uncharacterized protein n=1 Tax=Hymenobacter lucidus TaxID=2880930 RepID=A0ABS8AXP7_9BACT|nr:hypothetical protein [Hymenobacter lucidus]MCB2410562.1 hypothetical protein [Hymenobacter lucidus]